MKISNSKKQLAKIISENGGWRDGANWAAQDGLLGYVEFYRSRPKRDSVYWTTKEGRVYKFLANRVLSNWSNTILFRDEYFYLYPAPDAHAKVEVENRTSCQLTVTDGPTLEQLAADYRAKLAIAQQAQEEADSHRCGAEAALEKLVAAGKALGLVLSVAAPEPELAITDWRDLLPGDEIAMYSGRKLTVKGLRLHDESWPIYADDNSGGDYWCVSAHDWRFIRRPTKEGLNA